MARFVRALGLIVAFYLLWAGLEWSGAEDPRVSNHRAVGHEIRVAWIALASVVIATFVMVRLVEKLPWSAVALDRVAASPRLLFKGAALGGLTIGVASLALLGIRQLQIEPSIPGSWWGAAERSTATLLPAAFFEELFFRGYAFSVLRRVTGWKTALVVTSIAFGFVHAWNPGADAEAILAVISRRVFSGRYSSGNAKSVRRRRRALCVELGDGSRAPHRSERLVVAKRRL